jgi:hypothetical protein
LAEIKNRAVKSAEIGRLRKTQMMSMITSFIIQERLGQAVGRQKNVRPQPPTTILATRRNIPDPLLNSGERISCLISLPFERLNLQGRISASAFSGGG